MSYSSVFKFAATLVGGTIAIGVALFKLIRKKDDDEDEKKKKQKNLIPEETMIEYLNEISNTMVIVFQQLGYQAIDMTQQNMSDNEINDFLSNRFLEVKEKAEQNLCEDKSVSYSDYKYSYEYYQCHPSDRFRKATLPCWYILCILKDTMKPFIHLPHGLDIRHGLLIWNAITELTIKCIDRISTNLCDQLHCTEIELVSRIHENPGFRDTVYDLIIDAEKDCKKKVLNDEGIEEADFILFNLINRDSKQLSDGITAVENKKIEKLRNLGIYI